MAKEIRLTKPERDFCFENGTVRKAEYLIVFSYSDHIGEIQKILDEYCNEENQGIRIAFYSALFETVINSEYSRTAVPEENIKHLQAALKEFADTMKEKKTVSASPEKQKTFAEMQTEEKKECRELLYCF